MRSGELLSENSLQRNLANAKGKFSSLFMSSGEIEKKEKSSKRKSLEDSVRMEGFDVNANKATSHTDMKHHQPMAGHSEFWLG